jgi:type II secretory pathway pseudopilin PulG
MKHGRKNAFTLVEVLIAVSIFTVSIVGLLSIVATSQNNSIEGRLLEKAMFLAEQKMNEVHRVGYEPLDEEEDESIIVDESDENNTIKIFSKEGEFYIDSYDNYAGSEKNEWLKDYYWQVIIKESADLDGVQYVTVKVFNKNLTNKENEYTDVDYGVAAQLVTYLSEIKETETEKKDENK